MTEEMKATAAMNDICNMAKRARALCTEIVRQTSLTPYYGKVGGAAIYAAEELSEEQRRRISQAIRHMEHATATLYDIAVAGGMNEAKRREDRSGDHWDNKIQIINDDSDA